MTRAAPVPSTTISGIAVAKLRALSGALGYDEAQAQEMSDVFCMLASPWGDRAVGDTPAWPSDITDDHTPFEFSLAVDGAVPEIRFLIEVQGRPPSIEANWEAARAMTARLGSRFSVDTDRLATIEDLFTPTPECRRFAMWHAVCFPRRDAPQFKVYLNPQAAGWGRARALVEAALARLGLGDAELPAANAHDEICYLSLDLSGGRRARVKIYTAHYNATGAQIEAAIAGARGYVRSQASEFCYTMADSPGPYHGRPVLTCLSFVDGDITPTTGTIHFPIRAYAPSDAAARDRILSYMHAEGTGIYHRALESFAHRRLEDGVGMQTYVSLRQQRGHHRLTVYLAPELYDVGQTPMTQPKISGVVERLREDRAWFGVAESDDG